MTKTVTLESFLTKEQLKEAIYIIEDSEKDGSRRHRELRDKIIVPQIHEINRKLGQENDPDYLAYALEFALVKEMTKGIL